MKTIVESMFPQGWASWRGIVAFAVALFLFLPPLPQMRQVAAERVLLADRLTAEFAVAVFQKRAGELTAWQLAVVAVLREGADRRVLSDSWVATRTPTWMRTRGIPLLPGDGGRVTRFLETVDIDQVSRVAEGTRQGLLVGDRSDEDESRLRRAVWQMKIALLGAGVLVASLLTGWPAPPVLGLGLGIMLVLLGLIDHRSLPGAYWTEAVWFILGSFMSAVALVKTGLDKRLCYAMFRHVEGVRLSAALFFMIAAIALMSTVISDHAVAAVFYPIALILYRGSSLGDADDDAELGRVLLLAVAMACNIGGFGTLSGGARNIVMAGYLREMFDIDIGYAGWSIHALPYVLVMIPLTWLVLVVAFRPRTRDLRDAIRRLREDSGSFGTWSAEQRRTRAIFIATIAAWLLEKPLFELGLLPFRPGVGVIAVLGGVAYVLAGVVDWEDYQQGIDWGVIWLYGGAIMLGGALNTSGAAEFLGRVVLSSGHLLGFEGATEQVFLAVGLTGLLTQFLADGPTAAAMGPMTLSTANLLASGSPLVTLTALGTAAAASMSFCLPVGTPPNLIVFSSGYLRPRDFLRVGLPLLGVAMGVLLLLFQVWLWCYGWSG